MIGKGGDQESSERGNSVCKTLGLGGADTSKEMSKGLYSQTAEHRLGIDHKVVQGFINHEKVSYLFCLV